MRRQVDLPKAALAYEFPKCVVSDCLQIGRGEFTVLVSPPLYEISTPGAYTRGLLTQVAACTNWQAAISPASAKVDLAWFMVPFVAAHERLSPARDAAYLLPLGLNLSLGSEI
jgi:hypothetical protein